MNVLPMSEAPDSTAFASFLLITIAYLALLWVSVFIASRQFALISAGLLTAVAAMAYGSLVFPGGVILAPQLMKLGFLLVLGGIGLQLLGDSPVPPEPVVPMEDRHE